MCEVVVAAGRAALFSAAGKGIFRFSLYLSLQSWLLTSSSVT